MLPPKARHVEATLRTLGLDVIVTELAASTRSAQEAAAAVGCTLGQIVKSLVFSVRGEPMLVLTSGSNRVDEQRLRALVGEKVRKADAEFVRSHTGFAIGGVAPVGHPEPLRTVVDEDLLQYSEVWAAAGTPHTVFSCPPAFLAGLGELACIRRTEN